MSVLRPDVQFVGGPNAIQRVGLVLWWLALALSVLFAGLAIWVGWLMPRAESAMGIFLAFVAACVWAIGRGALFILAGR
jgi:hypothetical protein